MRNRKSVSAPPAWFDAATSVQPEHARVSYRGAGIHYQRWRTPDVRPALVLVHGHAAHAHWWDFIAPAFTDRFEVIAPDLSGAGDSDHRESYSASCFAGEIIACLHDAGFESATLVGHSFGGSMARVAAWQYPDAVEALVLVDSAIPSRRGNRTPPPMPRVRNRTYPSLAEGKRRFRLRPPQPETHDYIIDYIAGHSLRPAKEGYVFKLDPAVFSKMPALEDVPVATDMIRQLAMPFGFIYGEQSRFFDNGEAVAAIEQLVAPELLRRIPGAWHHVFLDRPLEFIAVLGDLLLTMGAGTTGSQ